MGKFIRLRVFKLIAQLIVVLILPACFVQSTIGQSAKAHWRKETEQTLLTLKLQLIELQQRYGAKHPQAMATKDQIHFIEEQLAQDEHAVILKNEKDKQLDAKRASLQQMENQYHDLQVQLEQAKARFGAGHPSIQSLKEQEKFWKAHLHELRLEVRNQLESTDEIYSNLAKLVDLLDADLQRLEPLEDDEEILAEARSSLKRALALIRAKQEIRKQLAAEAAKAKTSHNEKDAEFHTLKLETQLENKRQEDVERMKAVLIKTLQKDDEFKQLSDRFETLEKEQIAIRKILAQLVERAKQTDGAKASDKVEADKVEADKVEANKVEANKVEADEKDE